MTIRICRSPVYPSKNKPLTFQDVSGVLAEDTEGWNDLDCLARVRDDQALADYDALRWRRALARARELPGDRVAIDLGLVFG